MFHEAIKKQNDNDPTMFFNFNISIKKHFIKSTKYLDLYREPTLQNKIFNIKDKEIEFHLLFKTKTKSK